MKIEIGITEKEFKAIPWIAEISDILDSNFEEQPDLLAATNEITSLLARIYKVTENQYVINKSETNERDEDNVTIPIRRRLLSDQEKKGLKAEEIFMKEYGLYTGFVADRYWSRIFKAIYGYSPSLL